MPRNFHATALVLGDRGIVIAGESGLGKTQLSLALLCHAGAHGLFARLVSDDQIFLSIHHGRLLCAVPPAIAGLVEIRGLGPRPLTHEPRAPVDLLVRLVARDAVERFPEPETEAMLGCDIPLMRIAGDDRMAGMTAILARLALPPFC